SRAEVRARFDEIVAFSGVEQFLQTPVKRYSTGMYMRLAFAVAAHLEPEILIIDEVLAVGDAEFQRKCIGRMNELSHGHGRTVLFVSHNLDVVKQLCPRSIWLDNGRIRADGPTADVVSRYLEQHVAAGAAGSWIEMIDARRIGTGEIRFDRIRYSGTDDPQGLPRSGGPLRVDLVVNAQRNVKVASLAVRISMPGGQPLVVADPVIDTDLPLELGIGEHRLRLDIESLALSPGSYTLGLWLARGGGGRAWSVFDSIDDAVQLDVEVELGAEPRRGQAIVPCRSTLTRLDDFG
ncbi:MAG: Wzt carbohydrate-binding domain-containing protein, partial [Ilumatobacteraceae bacterium]